MTDAMQRFAETTLETMLSMIPVRTIDLPRNCSGVYGLLDHELKLRYIGITKAEGQSFYSRIHLRHRTGSEDRSHYFSSMYNCGRMWRDRSSQQADSDAKIAKRLRGAFVADHCRAVFIAFPSDFELIDLERHVLAIAPKEMTAWNDRRMPPYSEPSELVDKTIARLKLASGELQALARQHARYCAAFGR